MAGLFGIGGSSAHTDRRNQLGAWDKLNQIFNFSMGAGQNELGQGSSNLGTASDFWKTLLSGDRGKIAQTLSPEISTIQGAGDQNLKTLQAFGDRSGGTNAAIQKAHTDVQAQINTLINSLIPQAADEIAKIGAIQQQGGQNLLNTAESAAATVGEQASGARTQDQQLQQAQQGDILSGLMTLVFG